MRRHVSVLRRRKRRIIHINSVPAVVQRGGDGGCGAIAICGSGCAANEKEENPQAKAGGSDEMQSPSHSGLKPDYRGAPGADQFTKRELNHRADSRKYMILLYLSMVIRR